MEEDRSACKIVTDKYSRKTPLGRRRWNDNIRTNFKEIVINTRNWVNSAQNID